ncbi:hypothetical protein J8K87_09390 [Bacteroides fragilis]|uniref:hypothetical protein n=1 Tax=Bacteroides fragilis TaxID=817 RepID=UPI00202E3F4D|nr:hypothetical protein [Bacteroides fragilis]MCM0384411.1 hypothetical protein [Bacteroides fragilis]
MRMNLSYFIRIFTGMCLAIGFAACEKNNYYTTEVEEGDNEDVPIQELNVEARSQSWLGQMGDDYISTVFAYLAPSISKYYEMGDPFRDMTLVFDNPSVGQEINVTMKASAINEERTVTMLTTEDDRIEIDFPIKWKYDVFSSIKSTIPITMEWEFNLRGKTICRYSKQFKVTSFREDIYYFPLKKDNPADKNNIAILRNLDWGNFPIKEDDEIYNLSFNPFFFGYISPNNPMVNKLKQEAINDIPKISYGFAGSQLGNDYVKEQLAAFYWLMNKYGIIYSLGGTHLPTFAEVFNNGQGHCSTLTCAMATLCLSIGLDIALVAVPGHMYLLVLNQEGNPLFPMDCTMIWKIDKTLPFEEQIELSRSDFEYMLQVSAQEYEQDSALLEAGKAAYIVYPMTFVDYICSGIPSLDMPYVSGSTRAIDEDIHVTCRKAVEKRLSASSSLRKVSVR